MLSNRKSAGCTHVSAVLHALVAMTSTGFQVCPTSLTELSAPSDDDEEEVLKSMISKSSTKEKLAVLRTLIHDQKSIEGLPSHPFQPYLIVCVVNH